MAPSAAYCRALVQRLHGGSTTNQAEAADKLARLASEGDQGCAAVAAAGAIPALLRSMQQLLQHGGGDALVRGRAATGHMACALAVLCSRNPSRSAQLVESGGLDALLPLLSASDEATHMSAAAVLSSVATAFPGQHQQELAAAVLALTALLRQAHPSSKDVLLVLLTAVNNL